jgi:hypothetical protein
VVSAGQGSEAALATARPGCYKRGDNAAVEANGSESVREWFRKKFPAES